MKENLPVILLFSAMFISLATVCWWGLFNLTRPMFPSEEQDKK